MKYLLIVLSTLFFFVNTIGTAQTRSLQGSVTLDVASDQPLQLEVSVRNHNFVVIPPTFRVIRPIISRRNVVLSLSVGQTLAQFDIDQISTEAVDYTVQFRCIGCSDILPIQYFSFDGTRFGLANSVYIDPDELPNPMNVMLQTRGVVAGTVNLNGEPAAREVSLELSLLDASSQQIVSSQALSIAQGQAAVMYEFTGLRRDRAAAYTLELRCRRCENKVQRFGSTLSSDANHQNIDFSISLRDGVAFIAPLLDILLTED